MSFEGTTQNQAKNWDFAIPLGLVEDMEMDQIANGVKNEKQWMDHNLW